MTTPMKHMQTMPGNKENKKRKKWMMTAIVVLGCIILLIAAFWPGLTVRRYTQATDKVTALVRLVMLSDYHSTSYGDNQKNLVDAVKKQEPDIILMVGDMVDDERPEDNVRQLFEQLGNTYPCFYVSGNHECWTGRLGAVKEDIRSYGITVLEGDVVTVDIRGQEIGIAGVDDPCALMDEKGWAYPPEWTTQLESCAGSLAPSVYTVLLSHRPERMEDYSRNGFDLVLSGHAHGGQIRIPFIMNGLYAPAQGFIPAYAGGEYTMGDTAMIVGRGLARDWIPRIFNPPELVVVDIEPAV